jgi:hypothetical protein
MQVSGEIAKKLGTGLGQLDWVAVAAGAEDCV